MPSEDLLRSSNFAFLKAHDPQLVRLGALAERYFVDDPNTCLIKLRQFGELLAQMAAAHIGLYTSPDEKQVDLLRRLRDRGMLKGDVDRLFHELRKMGNDATHSFAGSQRTALSGIKYARFLGIWFHKVITGDRQFNPGPFIPPPDPQQETQSLKDELARLRQEVQQSVSSAEFAQAQALTEAQRRIAAEELAAEAEAKKQEFTRHLEQIQATSQTQSIQTIQQTVTQAQAVEGDLVLDERETRRLIDAQLRIAGWEVDTEELTYGKGARPQKGRNLAIAEWPTNGGRADYVLFVGLQAIAVVEAKRHSKDVSEDALNQAEGYSRGFRLYGEATLAGGPWGEYRVPFVFATNGREFLQQLRTKSGIWFKDVRRPQNRRYPLQVWYSPQGLADTLKQDVEQSHQKLAQEGFNYGVDLREYQIQAIRAVEEALAKDQRELLVAMATGTGKTKTCIALVYRLLKTKRFRRILFLVDRTALGEQATGAFKDTRMENLQTFADIFEIKELGDKESERDTKVHIATVQSMVKRVLYPSDDGVLTADLYDCIVVDECHRGYLLDRELSDTELQFRDFNDYVSKYRRVLDQFDAVKIGLTATPALHTTQIFGEPVFTYSYREAVVDEWLINHEPPIRIKTRLSEDGILWEAGDSMELFNPQTGRIDLTHAPDEVRIEVEQFNKRVITEDFNRVVCEALLQHIDPFLPGKTLIFCATDDHANIVVDKLRDALVQQYGDIEEEMVAKITGSAEKPLERIRKFRNEVNPKFAVTVDLLTTGIDVPSICNLVFIRRVNSRILYEQMVGRATRLCTFDDGTKKETFRIFDAVRLYDAIAPMTTMKPVVVNPNISFIQLVDELGTVTTPAAVEEIIDQLLTKIQRKQRHLSDSSREELEAIAGMPIPDLMNHLKESHPDQLREWFQQRQAIAEVLDRRDGGMQPTLISRHQDELLGFERGYGAGAEGATYGKPDDYLEGFKAFLQNNQNEIAALTVVMQRPRDLTRQQLKELKLLLTQAGYSEASLQMAWRDTTNQDIAASIIGFIRQAALGDALVPYGERVDRAMQKILSSRPWTEVQRRWLERIGKQLRAEVIVDREALDKGEFKSQGGGFTRLNKVFNGQLEEILAEIGDRLWQHDAG